VQRAQAATLEAVHRRIPQDRQGDLRLGLAGEAQGAVLEREGPDLAHAGRSVQRGHEVAQRPTGWNGHGDVGEARARAVVEPEADLPAGREAVRIGRREPAVVECRPPGGDQVVQAEVVREGPTRAVGGSGGVVDDADPTCARGGDGEHAAGRGVESGVPRRGEGAVKGELEAAGRPGGGRGAVDADLAGVEVDVDPTLDHAGGVRHRDGRSAGEALDGVGKGGVDRSSHELGGGGGRGGGVVRPVERVGGAGGEFAQLLAEIGQHPVAQLEHALDLAAQPAAGRHGWLAEIELQADDAGRSVLGEELEAARVLAREPRAVGGGQRRPSVGGAPDAQIDKAAELIDQPRLDVLGARGVGAGHGGARDLHVQRVDVVQQAVDAVHRGGDPDVGLASKLAQLAADVGGVVEEPLDLHVDLASAQARGRILAGDGEGVEDRVQPIEEGGGLAGVAEEGLGAVQELGHGAGRPTSAEASMVAFCRYTSVARRTPSMVTPAPDPLITVGDWSTTLRA
jgi:hypothetical protein